MTGDNVMRGSIALLHEDVSEITALSSFRMVVRNLRKVDQKYPLSSEMRCWRRAKIS